MVSKKKLHLLDRLQLEFSLKASTEEVRFELLSHLYMMNCGKLCVYNVSCLFHLELLVRFGYTRT